MGKQTNERKLRNESTTYNGKAAKMLSKKI